MYEKYEMCDPYIDQVRTSHDQQKSNLPVKSSGKGSLRSPTLVSTLSAMPSVLHCSMLNAFCSGPRLKSYIGLGVRA